jgi:hypothetical protein
MSKKIDINEKTDFTTAALVDHLNKEFGSKETGELFTLGDVQQYLRRGFLPKKYGNNTLERIENAQVGLKLIRLRPDSKGRLKQD